jgi:hypothetical protein
VQHGPRAPEREGEEPRRGRRGRGRDRHRERRDERPGQAGPGTPAFLAREDQVREEQRQEALRLSREEHHAEAMLPPPSPTPARQVEDRVPRAEERAPQTEERPQQVQEYRPEPQPQREPARPEQPRVDPKELLESAGLVMIETDRAKAPPPQQPDEPQHLGRPRRERPKAAAPEDEELVQIETGRK